MVTHVTEQTLLEGSWLALEQAGRLLRSAVSLLNLGDFGTAVALGMLGREELGRSRMLRTLSGEVSAGKTLSPKQVAQRCGDHVAKQEASALSITVRATGGQVNQTSDAAVEAKRKRQPHDRHAVRCDGIYVDLNDSGSDWKCPRDIGEQEARNHITDAVNDYACEFDRLTNEGLWGVLSPHIRAKEMGAARQKMSRTVDLPAPLWPKG